MARCRRAAILAVALLALSAQPAAARIAFVSERTDEPEIYVMEDDGSNPVDLTNDPAAPDLAPAWSPDAARIVYQRGFGGDADLWLMDADGSHQRVLVNSPGADTAPTWSPDGRKIAFVSDRSGDDHLYVMDADGTGVITLDTGRADPSDPAFSPDSRLLAYWDSDGQVVHVIDAAGTSDHIVGGPGPDALGGDQTPAWTPDGARLVFASLRQVAQSYDIWTMNLDGTNQRALPGGEPDREIEPAVAADGRIAYSNDAADDYDIYVMRPDGSQRIRLTNAEGDDTGAAWAPPPPSEQPVAGTSPGTGSSGTTRPTGPSSKKRTRLNVRPDYDHARILLYPRKMVVRIPYRVNRRATINFHLYLHGKLVAHFKHRGKPGPNIAHWQRRTMGPKRWLGTYKIIIVKAVEPPSSG